MQPPPRKAEPAKRWPSLAIDIFKEGDICIIRLSSFIHSLYHTPFLPISSTPFLLSKMYFSYLMALAASALLVTAAPSPRAKNTDCRTVHKGWFSAAVDHSELIFLVHISFQCSCKEIRSQTRIIRFEQEP